MTSMLAFVCGLPLPLSRPSPALRRVKTSTCTLVSDRPVKQDKQEPKQSRPSSYRVLPDNSNDSERPPRPPHHWSLPLIGIYIEQALGLYKTPFQRRDIYGPIHTANFFLGPRTYLFDYHAIIDVMRDDEVFRSKGAIPTFEPMFGADSMILLDGREHAIARAAFAPAFSPSLFPYYFKRALRRAQKTWESVHDAVRSGDEVRLGPVFRSHYLSIIIEMTTGLDIDSERWLHVPKLFEKGSRLFFSNKFSSGYKEGIRARDKLMAILKELVHDKLRTRADTIEKLREYGNDVVKLGLKDVSLGDVDILLVSIANSSLSTQPGGATDDAVVASLSRSILLLWFAGFMTAAVTSINGSFELGLNDEFYRRLVDEQDSIVATANGNVEVTYEQTTSQMPLMDSFLNEVLRMYPAVRGAPRKVARDVEILGRYVPKDSIVFCSFFVAHRDPAIYSEPNTFKLDRFLKKPGKPKPPTVLTFGTPGSVHYCLGAAFSKVLMKTTLSTLLRGFRYTLDPKQSTKYRMFPEATPESGVLLDKFERRKY